MENFRTGARLLETLTSALYADPIIVFREYVQNAVDSFRRSDNSTEHVVDITINIDKKIVMIEDNGSGITVDKFESTMRNISRSDKDGDDSQIGFRGIGRLAGLAFCEKLWFINRKDKSSPQYFFWNCARYREILNSRNGAKDLDDVIGEIANPSDSCDILRELKSNSESTFIVILQDVKQELIDCITESNSKNKKATTIAEDYSNTFRHALELLLPLPYAESFEKKQLIQERFKEVFGYELSKNQFNVKLNGDPLFKPFSYDEKKDFQMIPIEIFPVDSSGTPSDEPQTIGLLWMTFDYVFKAAKDYWGIAVRSKNMLVRGKSVLAEEAFASQNAITTYNQYLAAIKGVSGELFLETTCLKDNSRRDWFNVDYNSLQLRTQLCALMNKMHIYRYKMSRFIHNDNRTEADKEDVIKAYSDFTSRQDPSPVSNFLDARIAADDERETDPRADERDIVGYSMPQKRFYREIMMQIYEYFEDKEKIDYYKLKSFIVKKLNRESENEPFSSEDRNA